jgi:5-methylcytosine-specific restriction protein A
MTGRPWRRLREQILRRDNYLCQCDECRKTGAVREAHEVDHIIPLARGGSDEPHNLRAINRACHAAKTAKEAQEGRQRPL